MWPSTPVCSKLIPAVPFLQTMICSLSYQRFVQVPIWTPFSTTLVPQSMFILSSEPDFGDVESRHSTKMAVSTILRHSTLLESVVKTSRRWAQILRFSVERTPRAFLAASCIGIVSASSTMAWRFWATSFSVMIRSELSSKTSNQ